MKPDTNAMPLSLLLPYQRRWVLDESRFKIGLWSRQTGKSFACACEAVLSCAITPKVLWVVLSAGERQAVEFVAKAKQWAEAIDLVVTEEGLERVAGEFKRAEIRFTNGSRVVAIPANPDTARGYSGNVILDEFGFHHDSDAIWKAIYPTITNVLTGLKKLRIVSTPNGRDNKLYDLWTKADGYSKHKVTIEDAIREGLPVDLPQLRAGIDSEDAWQQEYLCEFLDAAGTLLPYDLVRGCESDLARDEGGEPIRDQGLRRYCGVDVGTVNDPTVCVTLEEQADSRLVVTETLVLRGMDLSLQAEMLRPRLRRAELACLDASGLGTQLAQDFTRELGGKFEACVFTANFKREIFPAVRRAFQDRRLAIPPTKAWRDDLTAVRESFGGGQPSYWAPRTDQGHSDRTTALALAHRAATRPTSAFIPKAFSRGAEARRGRALGHARAERRRALVA